jgi:hypothetical protein
MNRTPVTASQGATAMTCYGCGKSGHGIRTCPDLDEIAKKDIAVRNPDGKIVWKDGSFVARNAGETIVDAIKRQAKITNLVATTSEATQFYVYPSGSYVTFRNPQDPESDRLRVMITPRVSLIIHPQSYSMTAEKEDPLPFANLCSIVTDQEVTDQEVTDQEVTDQEVTDQEVKESDVEARSSEPEAHVNSTAMIDEDIEMAGVDDQEDGEILDEDDGPEFSLLITPANSPVTSVGSDTPSLEEDVPIHMSANGQAQYTREGLFHQIELRQIIMTIILLPTMAAICGLGIKRGIKRLKWIVVSCHLITAAYILFSSSQDSNIFPAVRPRSQDIRFSDWIFTFFPRRHTDSNGKETDQQGSWPLTWRSMPSVPADREKKIFTPSVSSMLHHISQILFPNNYYTALHFSGIQRNYNLEDHHEYFSETVKKIHYFFRTQGGRPAPGEDVRTETEGSLFGDQDIDIWMDN